MTNGNQVDCSGVDLDGVFYARVVALFSRQPPHPIARAQLLLIMGAVTRSIFKSHEAQTTMNRTTYSTLDLGTGLRLYHLSAAPVSTRINRGTSGATLYNA
jgi:hypothetical protein